MTEPRPCSVCGEPTRAEGGICTRNTCYKVYQKAYRTEPVEQEYQPCVVCGERTYAGCGACNRTEACHLESAHRRGGPHQRKPPQPERACEICGAMFVPIRAGNVCCSVGCGVKYAAKYACLMRRLGLAKPSSHNALKSCLATGARYDRTVDRMVVFVRDGWRCQRCGRKVSLKGKQTAPRRAEMDHIIPLSRGGSHTWENVQCLCKRCNMSKWTRVGDDQLLLVG